jgi:hypothetical protein
LNIAVTGKDVALKISLLNKGNIKGEGIKAALSATRKSAAILKGEAAFGNIEIGKSADSKSSFVFHVQSDTVGIEKFRLKISDKSNNEWVEYIEIPVFSKDLPEITDFEIADGRVVTVAKEGVHEETIFLGKGNGDGIANPGESIVILVKDKDRLWRTSLTCYSKYINPFGINTRTSDYWGSYDHVGGSAKCSVPLISSDCPANQPVSFITEYWLPDYPNHIIKKGWVTLKVTGKDETAPELQWIKVTGDNVIQARIFDGSQIKNVSVRLILKTKPDSFLEFELKDDGKNGDVAESDNVFSFKVPEQKFGLYNAEITAIDSFGNILTQRSPGIFVLH